MRPGSPQSRGTARLGSVAAPVRGWNTRDPLAQMEPGFAPVLDNLLIEGPAPRVRQGYRVWAEGLPGAVGGLLPYTGAGATQSLFAASGAGIYNVTAAGTVGAPVVSGLTSSRWDSVNFAALGGNFLLAWNGADTEQTYNGTTWANWTATGLTGRVIWGGSFKGRLIVGTSNRLSFYYGGAGAIAGAFTEFPLQGVARRGGSVVAFVTLTIDGAEGPDDLAAFITSEGEVLVYAGTDPSSVSTWGLVGRWQLPRPVGAPHRCVTAWGGDALLMTDAGVVPLSAFRTIEDGSEVVERAAVTRNIAPTWRDLTQERRTLSGWQIAPLSRYSLVIMNVPWQTIAPPPPPPVVVGRTHVWWNNDTADNAPYGAVSWDTIVENDIGAVVSGGSITVPAGVTGARIQTQVWIDAGFGDNGKTATYEVRNNGMAVATNSAILPDGGVFVNPNLNIVISQFDISVIPGDVITGFTSCSEAPNGFIYVGDDPSWTFIIIDWLA